MSCLFIKHLKIILIKVLTFWFFLVENKRGVYFSVFFEMLQVEC